MHPAASVIFFTVLSGAGYGLWSWIALHGLIENAGAPPDHLETRALLLGMLLVTVGLCSSLLHLGQPQRAWRALSQWRSSWLSREGVLALLGFAPAFAMLLAGFVTFGEIALSVLRFALLLLSLATVFATSMIYASLRPIPAWRLPQVVPVYLLFALLTGAALLLFLQAVSGRPAAATLQIFVVLLAPGLGALKWIYWRQLDRKLALPRRAEAVGMPLAADVSPWEDPHTESSFITREMVFVLARKHRLRLRSLAALGVAWLPMALVPLAWLLPALAIFSLTAVLLSTMLGALIERWLFFAEARHTVSVYFR